MAHANEYAAQVLACPTPPGLLAKVVGKMGLKGVAGLVIVKEGQQGQNPSGGSRGQVQRGGGDGGAPGEQQHSQFSGGRRGDGGGQQHQAYGPTSVVARGPNKQFHPYRRQSGQ